MHLLRDRASSLTDENPDPRAEGIVQDALNRVSANKTTLIIAHKLATVRAADNIVVMSYGRILEQGTHRELIARDGQYASLVRAQDLGGDSGEADFSKEEADVELDRAVTLQRTNTETKTTVIDAEIQHLTSGTVGYSLVRCIMLMMLEQKNMYWCFAISGFCCLIGGGTYPAQALIFSRLIQIFTLTGQEAQNRANFFALMFFIVALANLFAYFAIGWFCNLVRVQVLTLMGHH